MSKLEVYRVMLEIHPCGLGDLGWMGKPERNSPEGSRAERQNTKCV